MNPEIVKKILQYAPEPPARIWESISKSLDEDLPGDVTEKLYNYQVLPPEGTWNKIEGNLNQHRGAIIKRPFFNVARVAAAAAVILIATASILFWNRDSDQSFVAGENPKLDTPGIRNGLASPSPSITLVEQQPTETNHAPALMASNKSPRGQVKNTYHSKPERTKQNFTSDKSSLTAERNFIPNHAEEKAIAVASYPMDKYMVYSDDDGNAMRLPKKLFELINCVKEEIVCQEKIQQMQSRFASYITTNDFSGVMEMLRNMKENK